MKFSTDSTAYPGKPQNEDFSHTLPTTKGHLFFVLDFANFAYPTLSLNLQTELKQTIEGLDKLPGLSVQSFLGHLGKDLNNFVFSFGQDNCDGKLFCVAVIALVRLG